MTVRKVYLFSALALAALAILTFLRLSTTKAEGNRLSADVLQQETVPTPKSTIGARGLMAFVIKEILPGSAAEQAGLRPGDLVTVLEQQIESIQDFQGRIGNSEPGTSFKIVYQRFNRSTAEWEEHKGTIQSRAFRASVSLQTPYFKVAGTRRLDCPYGCCEFCTHTKVSECLVACCWTGKIDCYADPDGICSFYFCT
jgi:membrane-associated protease RseP (regulator of RpoE activity)